MSSSNARILLETPQAPLGLRLLDHQRREVAHGVGSLERQVRPGLYTLEVDAGPTVERRFIEVPPAGYEDREIRVDIPSAAPIGGTSTVHEFHGYPSQDLSRTPNRSFGHGGRLMIFVRNTGDDPRSPVNVDGLELVDAGMQVMASGSADFEQRPGEGWAGLSADVDPAGYALRLSRPRRRSTEGQLEVVDQSLWVEEGWITLVFLPFREVQGYPEPEYASIHMASIHMGFDPYESSAEPANLALEIALSGLRQGRAVVPRDLENLMLWGKFGNPMLGIVGAHALLQAQKPRWRMFDTVRKNLQRLVPHHPDVLALHLMGKQHRGDTSNSRVPTVPWPPMLLDAYRAVIERDADEAERLIPEGSIADFAASRVYSRGPWSMWRSLDASRIVARAPVWQERVTEAVAKLSEMTGRMERPAAMYKLRQSWRKALEQASKPAQTRRRQRSGIAAMTRTARQESAGEGPDSPETALVAGYLQELTSLTTKYGVEPTEDALELRSLSDRTGLPTASVARALLNIASKGFSF